MVRRINDSTRANSEPGPSPDEVCETEHRATVERGRSWTSASMTLLCPECFHEKTLKRHITVLRAQTAGAAKCVFHTKRKGVSARQIAQLFDPVVRGLYQRGQYDWEGRMKGAPLTDLIADLGEVEDERVAALVADELIMGDPYLPQTGDERFFDSEFRYESSASSFGVRFSTLWEHLRQDILHISRFFNNKIADALGEIFADVHRQQSKAGPAVYLIGPGSLIDGVSRARIADDASSRQLIRRAPWTELAVPPELARKGGRMNAAGIGVFYGGFDEATCIAELRPPVGSTVVIGRFRVLRELCVLDLSRFAAPQKKASNFARDQMRRNEQWSFLQRFRREISSAILDSKSHLAYVPTQAVAEYIAAKLTVKVGGRIRGIDGLIYESAQHQGGKNIALFGAAGHVKVPPSSEQSNDHGREMVEELFGLPDRRDCMLPGLEISTHDVSELFVTGAQYSVSKLSGFEDHLDAPAR